MADQIPPKSEPILRNPQVVATIIGGIITLVVAVVGILPALLNNREATPQATVLVIIATAIPATNTAAPIPTIEEPTRLPINDIATAVNTPLPTLEPTLPPAPTPVITPTSFPQAAPNVLLLYDNDTFSLLNQGSAALSLEGVTFHSSSGDWDARSWGTSIYNSLPANMCLRLRDAGVGQRQPPPPCRNKIYGLIEVGTSGLFWKGVESFEVLRDGQIVATCQIADQTCLIAIS
jgi:hypothetical protein